ncbi:MAG TPA: hypothetical protein VMN39_09875 [Longimicrobiaceae bacterium]|nr:hypothetical protein [Longimicrobiaceae bacterium]
MKRFLPLLVAGPLCGTAACGEAGGKVGPDESIYVGIRDQDHDAMSTGVMKLNRDWEVISRIGFSETGDAVFSSVHDLAVGDDGAIYVAETRGRKVHKFVPAGDLDP